MESLAAVAAHVLNETFPGPTDRPFTYAEAAGLRIPRSMLRTLTACGALRRPVSGVYVSAALPDSPALRAACLKLVAPPDCVIVDRHAGWLLGADMVLAPGEHLALRPLSIFRPSGHGRLRNDLSHSGERWLRDSDVIEMDGVRVTSPLRTAWDLGRVRWADEAIAGMDAIAGLPGFDHAAFRAGVDQFRGHRWVRTLRAVAPLVDGRSESPPESILRLRCHEAGLSMIPQLNVFRDCRLLGRLDLGDPHRRAGVEYDGAEWHRSPGQRAHDQARRRELAEDGWLIEVFRKEDVFTQNSTVDARLALLRERLRRRARTASGR